ncbi:hypothetical protein [Aureimonas frigidaquae]|uniref:hypothetical protein n=1 Tax=Aureimonas frigidaquae TaxID=424757 RepID=UPI000780A4D4|nr:hypothetical protein [Aureimonas frigidaquae]
MRKLTIAGCSALLLAVTGCQSVDREIAAPAAIGGLGGAAIGAAATGDLGGALIGGAIGTAAGALVGASTRRGECVYRDDYGRRYTAQCPRGYRG